MPDLIQPSLAHRALLVGLSRAPARTPFAADLARLLAVETGARIERRWLRPALRLDEPLVDRVRIGGTVTGERAFRHADELSMRRPGLLLELR